MKSSSIKLKKIDIAVYSVTAWIGNRIADTFYLAMKDEPNFMDGILKGLDNLDLFKNPIPSLHLWAIIGSIMLPFFVYIAFTLSKMNKKNYRPKAEHGSARYGELEEINWMKDK